VARGLMVMRESGVARARQSAVVARRGGRCAGRRLHKPSAGNKNRLHGMGGRHERSRGDPHRRPAGLAADVRLTPARCPLARASPVPVLIFAPAVLILAAWQLASASVLASAGLAIAGYALWTLFEYWLHRVVFHFEPQEGLGARLHWIIHGVHHDHPNDPLRLGDATGGQHSAGGARVRDPLLDLRCSLRARTWRRFFTGYLAYDMIHYYIHHFRPRGPLGRIAARAAHAPSLPGRHPRLRDQRSILGRGLPDLLAQALSALEGSRAFAGQRGFRERPNPRK